MCRLLLFLSSLFHHLKFYFTALNIQLTPFLRRAFALLGNAWLSYLIALVPCDQQVQESERAQKRSVEGTGRYPLLELQIHCIQVDVT